jgi:autotransporter-associated beta strand protein
MVAHAQMLAQSVQLRGTLVENRSMNRPKPRVTVLSVGLFAATIASAHAQSWSLYDDYTSLSTIPFVKGPISSGKPAKVDLEVGDAKTPIPFVMDTGSTGIVVSKRYFKPGPNDKYVGNGKQVYSSSGKVEHGKYYVTDVVIYQNKTTPLATAQVTILDVTHTTCLPHHPKCKSSWDPKVAYMGIGFDATGKSATQPKAPYNNTNPFINIVSLASGQPVSTLAPGYMITNSGVTLGLSPSDTKNFAFVKLQPNTTSNQPAPAWLRAPLTILAGGKETIGTTVPDTGISDAYLTPAPGASLTTEKCGKHSSCLQPGNTIDAYLPGQTAPQPAFYTFTTGASGNALEPDTVKLNKASTTAYLNTGRNFFAGFNYLYDPVNGYVGYGWNGTVSSAFGSVTPSAALIGNVNLPAGFTGSLPTVLYGATTLLPAGTGIFSNAISGSFGLTIAGGAVILAGINTYSGPTTVNAGTLDVRGSIASSSLTTIAGGARLTGDGTVGPVQINSRGTLLPGEAGALGTSLNVAGNLAFASGAIYLVQISPSSTTSANVSGIAILSGATLNASFASGAYLVRQYDVLHADAGVNGTFGALAAGNVPPGFVAVLSYSQNDVFVDLNSALPNTGLPGNAQKVATSLNNYFNSGGALTANFFPIFGLTDGTLANALTRLDGEVATGSEIPALQLMDEFLNLMLDPFVDGRLGSGASDGGGSAMGFAPDAQTILPPDVALAYAGVLKAPPAPAFQQRWTTWAASYGGANTTAGDPAGAGSSNLAAQTFGFVAGMDYHYSPDTIVGFGLGVSGTAWGLAGGMGTGRSDAFQSGVYGMTRWGAAYVGASLAFANHWMTTHRATMNDILNASFDAQSYGGRIEGGYRFAVLPALGVSPYAAVQAQAFHTPSYSETDVTSGGFGLNYAAMNATDTRTELGARLDDPSVIGGIPVLLRGRIAWAHDFVSDPTLSAAFESLPGSNFIVNGATIPHDSALTSAGAEIFFTPRWSLLVKFDGDFAPASQTYAGSGTLRYGW